MKHLLLSLCLVNIVLCQHKYSFLNFMTTASWINPFATFYTSHEVFCLAQCNLNTDCLSLVFNKDPQTTPNCFLFKTDLNANELVSCNSSILFIKECKFVFTF